MRALLIASPFLALALYGVASKAAGGEFLLHWTYSSDDESRDGSGPGAARSFAVGNFDAVSLQGSDDVRIVRGSAISVVANGPQSILDKLDIRVEGSTLKVGRKRQSWGMGWSDDKGAVVTVTMPSIKAAAVAGSGDMTLDRADGEAFDGSVAGSGSLKLASLAVKRAKLSIAGSGDLAATGASEDSALSIAGSGDMDASRLQSRRADISISGSGDLKADASESAAISIAGSGDATVTGSAKCTIARVGSGDANCGR